MGDYCKNLIEFCSGKAVNGMCHNIKENIYDGSFSRLTYDMMLAWERPSYFDEELTVFIEVPDKKPSTDVGDACKDNVGNHKAACSKRNAKNITSCPNKILNIFPI
ncbi:hypothetical protein V8G54_022169 [Vigna mungo]|uniref:Uncharacterized protein n=1 Tax=Vigna mungo TaxID=3915 RepID=A0AAQ3RXK8_VIGMU